MNIFSTPIRQKFLFALLYFCEGAPIGFIWWMLPAQLRIAGIPVEQITLVTSILVLPWAFKFLWAPVVDSLQNDGWNLKAWIITSQILMCVSLLPLLVLNLSVHYQIIFFFLLFHAIAAATQDVAIDALCISTIPHEHQGSINGWMQTGMLTGRSLFGGVALIAASHFGNNAILLVMIAIIVCITIIISFLQIPATRAASSFTETMKTMSIVARERSTWYGMLFAIIGGTAYEGAGAVAGPFLVDRGFSTQTIGLFFSVFSVTAMIFGALAGGRISDRMGKHRAVVYSIGTVSATALLLSAAELFDHSLQQELLFTIMTLLYFGIGLFTVSSYALFMEITDKRLGATQFSAFMGGTNMCESLSAYSAGKLVSTFNYSTAFSSLALVSLLSVPLVKRMKTRTEHNEVP